MIREDIAELPSGRWEVLPDGSWQHAKRPEAPSRSTTIINNYYGSGSNGWGLDAWGSTAWGGDV